MKKIFSLLIVSAALSGCQKEAGAGENKSAAPKIGVAIYRFDDTFMSSFRREIELNAQGKAEVNSVDGQNSQATQNDQADLFITQGFDGLIVNPVDRTASGVLSDKAKTANLPLVFINREPLEEDMEKWERSYYVGSRAQDSGRMGAEMVLDYFKANPSADRNGDGILQYAILMGQPGHQDAILRTSSVKEYFAQSGAQTELVAEDYANFDRIRGQEIMSAFLAAYGNRIEAVICNNDDMALGAIEALKSEGYFSADGAFMPVVGVDATAPALDAIAEGTLLGTALNDAKKQGKAAFDVAYTSIIDGQASTDVAAMTNQAGDAPGRYVWVPYQKVTRENYQSFKQ